MSDAKTTAAILDSHKDEILDAWVKSQLSDPRIGGEAIGRKVLETDWRDFFEALVQEVGSGVLEDPDAPGYDRLRKRLSEIAIRRERSEMSAFGTAAAITSLKLYCLPVFQEEYEDDRDKLREHMLSLTKLVDALGLLTYETLIKRREAMIHQQSEELMEVSTPVVQVWDGIVATPLIGTLDSERTQRFMERLLETVVETKSPIALMDITGVPAVDTQTAQHLIDTIAAVRLVGAQVILTGVRPSIAQTLVHLGVNLSDIVTRSSFADGLRVAMDRLELEVVPRSGVEAGG